ncbi:MAG: class I SAM-dependent methyltransferase [Candidatus Diapherotrites archaeon]|nr:class I SAM-dependent methyltransferase [Candidatus Diapherotrites archaeon]
MTEHYYSKKQTSKLIRREWAVEVGGKKLFFETASGTFSPRKLDIGTRALLKYMALPEKGRVLDLGCGNGVIGIVAAAENPRLELVLSDVNSRAVMESRKNIKRNKLKNAKAIQSDLFQKITGGFDCILSNPPISAGRKTVFAMVEESFGHLNPGGSLQMVARKTKGGEMLSKEMERVFGNVEDIGRQSGFHVYKSVKQ